MPGGRRSRGRVANWQRHVPLVPILIALIVISVGIGQHVFWLWIPLLFLIWRLSRWQRGRSTTAARRGPGDWI